MSDAIKRGGIAAFMPDVQDEERKKIRPTDACVRIRYSKEKGIVVFESSSPQISAIHAVAADENISGDDGYDICVDGMSYATVVSRLPSGSHLSLKYKSIPAQDDANTGIIHPDGKITTIIESNGEKIGNANNDAFPVKHFSGANYNFTDILFTIKAAALKKAIKSVSFATDSQYSSGHAMAYIIIAIKDNKAHCAGTDGRRCAVFSIDEQNITLVSDEMKGVDKINKMLFNPDVMTKTVGVFDDADEISFVRADDSEHIMLTSPKTKIKLCIPPQSTVDAYPDFLTILNLQTQENVVVNRKEMLTALNLVELYNKEKALITFHEDNQKIKVEAARRGVEPENMMVTCDPTTLKMEKPLPVSNPYLQEGLKKTESDKIRISFTSDFLKMKIEPANTQDYIYIMQSMSSV